MTAQSCQDIDYIILAVVWNISHNYFNLINFNFFNFIMKS